jgi:dethiobiotin synthetase
MKEIYFITATNTNVGKTYASEKFLLQMANDGKKVGYFKPIETGVIDDMPSDALSIFELLEVINPDFDVLVDDICPYRFRLPASPYVAKKDTVIDIDFLVSKKDYLLSKCDVLIIEGAGGLMVPITKEIFMIDLIKIFQAKAILITPSNLGCINDTLLSIDKLRSKNIDFQWYINLYKEKLEFESITLRFYEDYFGKENLQYL